VSNDEAKEVLLGEIVRSIEELADDTSNISSTLDDIKTLFNEHCRFMDQLVTATYELIKTFERKGD
jgi:hypothetical protein